MNSSRISTAFKYALLLTPAAVLSVLIAFLVLSASVAGVLREPAQFSGSPAFIQKLTRAAYRQTRTHWQTVPDCVVFDPQLLYRPRPGNCVFENAEFRTTMHFDNRGARLTATPLPSPAAAGPEPRIVLVGDSHAMGWGVEDHETFASVLASEYGYPTINLAVSSYATPRELLRLRRDLVLQPDDVIVIQYCDNDVLENQRFAARATVGPYEPAKLQALLDHRPARATALPVAGVLLRTFWDDLATGLRRHPAGQGANLDPTTAFLRVLNSYPELKDHRVLVVAINGPGLGTHLRADQLAAADVPLLVPQLLVDDFHAIDDHMRLRGHRTVAAEIAAWLGQGIN